MTGPPPGAFRGPPPAPIGPRWKAFAVVGVLLVAANVAYAVSVPDVLNDLTPSMPLGLRESSSPVAQAGATFVDVTDEAGFSFHRYAWRDGDLPYPAVVGGGVAAGDVDGDGWVDLYFTPGGPQLPGALYKNNGDWTFTNVAAEAGLAIDGFGTGASFGDFDNDGDADLYVIIDDGGRLFVNDGAGVFTDVTDAAGLTLDGACGERPCQGSSVVWFDYDRDGDLDLYVVNNLDWRTPGLRTSGQDYASLIYFAAKQVSLLYRNDGGTFVEVTDQARVPNTGKGLGVAIADFDGDGWPDFVTANDITENALYINTQQGSFVNEGRAAGVNELLTSMGVAAGDVDGDARPDIVTSNFRGHKLSLQLQQEPLRFTKLTDERGLGASWRGTGWGVALFDYDLDGWLDIAHAVGRAVPLEPHRNDLNNLVFEELVQDSEDQLFRNLGGGHFAEVTYSAGAFPGNSTTRAILAVDLDNDGDEDIVRVNVQGEAAEVLRNDRANAFNSLQFVFTGTGANVTKEAVGTKVVATLADGTKLVRYTSTSAGYQTGLSRVLTIGLGEATEADVEIVWPDGTTQSLGPMEAGRHSVTQDAS